MRNNYPQHLRRLAESDDIAGWSDLLALGAATGHNTADVHRHVRGVQAVLARPDESTRTKARNAADAATAKHEAATAALEQATAEAERASRDLDTTTRRLAEVEAAHNAAVEALKITVVAEATGTQKETTDATS